MSLKIRLASATIATWLLVIGATGCGRSKPTYYFVLDCPTPKRVDRLSGHNDGALVVGIAPIDVAKYIDRNALVLRTSAVTVEVADHHAWAEPLVHSMMRTVAAYLDREPDVAAAIVLPTIAEVPLDRVILLQVLRFDGMLGSRVNLSARLIILDGSREPLHQPIWLDTSAETSDGSYEALITAKSELLVRLSKDIAEALRVVD